MSSASDRPAFHATPAVAASRAHNRYVSCPVCQADSERYLFHRSGVRFVRCGSCGAVYINPAREEPKNDLFIEHGRPFSARDRELMVRDFEALLATVEADYRRITGRAPERTLLLGRYLPEFRQVRDAGRLGLAVAEIDDAVSKRLATDSDIDWAAPLLCARPDLVILHELLESCSDPGKVLQKLVSSLPESTLFVVTYTNADSLPARMMRRHWTSFSDYKSVYLSTGNITALLARFGLVLKAQHPMPVTRTVGYVGDIVRKIAPVGPAFDAAKLAQVDGLSVPVRAGNRVAVFGRAAVGSSKKEKLSIVLPVYNEVRFAKQIIDAVLAKKLPIDRELIIVESNSKDGTKEVVQKYEGISPDIRVVWEDRPRGKGHAVRTGLKHVTGTIILIQDADFEYDIEDYDALLEPILKHKTMFVLGSRSLGLDDWKVRRYDSTPVKGFLLNFAQMMFAETYNLLYQQRTTDINTMFKVFRAECLDGLDLHSNGFELDIELVCKLARNGNSPMEVPVNYVARGFEDGKKIRFWRDAIPSYASIYLYRLTR